MDVADIPRFAAILRRLGRGFGTVVHGDVHPGNFLASADGMALVDWSMARPSLHLLDLDYVDSLDLEPPNCHWSTLRPPEADAVLSAYAAAIGWSMADVRHAHVAVMAWREASGVLSLLDKPERAPACNAMRARLRQILAAAAGDGD